MPPSSSAADKKMVCFRGRAGIQRRLVWPTLLYTGAVHERDREGGTTSVCDGGSSHHSVLRSSVRAVPSASSAVTEMMAVRRTRLPDDLRRHRPERTSETNGVGAWNAPTNAAKRWSAVSDGGEDQGAEEALWGRAEEGGESSRQFRKRAVSRERLFLSAR